MFKQHMKPIVFPRKYCFAISVPSSQLKAMYNLLDWLSTPIWVKELFTVMSTWPDQEASRSDVNQSAGSEICFVSLHLSRASNPFCLRCAAYSFSDLLVKSSSCKVHW